MSPMHTDSVHMSDNHQMTGVPDSNLCTVLPWFLQIKIKNIRTIVNRSCEKLDSTQISNQNLVKSAKLLSTLQKSSDQDGGEKSKRKCRCGHLTGQARNRESFEK